MLRRRCRRNGAHREDPLRLLVVSVYPEDQAGTRLRAHALRPDLEAAGFAVAFWSFLSLTDSTAWFGGAGRLHRVAILLTGLLRTAGLPRRIAAADVVLVLREALPIASDVVERFASRRARLVWDVDDAVWTQYPRLFLRWVPERLRRTADKYARIAARADEVWAGSDELARWCAQWSDRVVVVPTAVPVPEVAATRAARRPTLGWVGSASTGHFLEQLLHDLGPDVEDLEVECVGATDVRAPAGMRLRRTPWSETAERTLLDEARVGLYPVDLRHPLGPAKAGLKAVLYMAHGLPCVVTPTPAIAAIVRDGREGLHARTPAQWRAAVTRLTTDDALWDSLALAGHRRALEHYSTQVWAPRLAERLRRLATGAA